MLEVQNNLQIMQHLAVATHGTKNEPEVGMEWKKFTLGRFNGLPYANFNIHGRIFGTKRRSQCIHYLFPYPSASKIHFRQDLPETLRDLCDWTDSGCALFDLSTPCVTI